MASFTPHGKHLIAGAWVPGETTFASDPAHGPSHDFAVGTPALVDAACQAAEEAFWTYGYTTREARAAFLDTIADEIEARADAITEIGTQETGLPEARLIGERGRTTGQLRLFAAHIRKGDYLDRRHDPARHRSRHPRPGGARTGLSGGRPLPPAHLAPPSAGPRPHLCRCFGWRNHRRGGFPVA